MPIGSDCCSLNAKQQEKGVADERIFGKRSLLTKLSMVPLWMIMDPHQNPPDELLQRSLADLAAVQCWWILSFLFKSSFLPYVRNTVSSLDTSLPAAFEHKLV